MEFEEFIALDIKDEDGNTVGHFSFEDNKLYVIGMNKKLEFRLCYNKDYVPYYLALAYQKLLLG